MRRAASRKSPSVARHHVGLVNHRHPLAPVVSGKLECRSEDSLRAFAGIDLAGNGPLVRRQSLEGSKGGREFLQQAGQALRHRVKLHPGIEVFRILTEDDQIDTLPGVERVAGKRPAGPQADVKVEVLAHAHDRRAIDQSLSSQLRGQLPLGLPHRLGGDGSEQGRIHSLQQFYGAAGKGIAFLAPEFPANVAGRILRVQTQTIQHDPGGLQHLPAHPVSRQPGNPVLGHALSSSDKGTHWPLRGCGGRRFGLHAMAASGRRRNLSSGKGSVRLLLLL